MSAVEPRQAPSPIISGDQSATRKSSGAFRCRQGGQYQTQISFAAVRSEVTTITGVNDSSRFYEHELYFFSCIRLMLDSFWNYIHFARTDVDSSVTEVDAELAFED